MSVDEEGGVRRTHDNTAARDGGLDERVQLLIAANGELQVARRDALHLCATEVRGRSVRGARRQRSASAARLQVLGGVARQLQHLGGEVLFTRRARGGGVSRRLRQNSSRQAELWAGQNRRTRTEDGGAVDGGRGADAATGGSARLGQGSAA